MGAMIHKKVDEAPRVLPPSLKITFYGGILGDGKSGVPGGRTVCWLG